MARSRLVEVDYHEFKRQLEAAGGSGQRIERTEHARWSAYVKQHEIREASSVTLAKAQASGEIRAVIIDGDGPWAGYYVYSPDDQLCWRFQREEDAPA